MTVTDIGILTNVGIFFSGLSMMEKNMVASWRNWKRESETMIVRLRKCATSITRAL